MKQNKLNITDVLVDFMKSQLTEKIGEDKASKMNGKLYKFCGELNYDVDAVIHKHIDYLIGELK